jgi:hypothetical protein
MLQEIGVEAARLQEDATFGQQGNLEAAKGWASLGWLLGSIIAAGSAVGGVLTFASPEYQHIGGSLALVAAVATGVHGTLRPARRAERARSVAVLYSAARDRARRLRTVDLVSSDSADELRDRLVALTDDLNTANGIADPTPRWAYLLAKKNIEREQGQTHMIDR